MALMLRRAQHEGLGVDLVEARTMILVLSLSKDEAAHA